MGKYLLWGLGILVAVLVLVWGVRRLTAAAAPTPAAGTTPPAGLDPKVWNPETRGYY